MKKCTMEPAELVRLYEVEGWTLRRIGEAAGVSGGRVREIRDRYIRHREHAASSYARPAIAERMRNIWTIYDRPNDYPETFVARQYVIREAYAEPVRDTAVVGPLDALRVRLERAGLVKVGRQEADEPQIVESWI
jgi:hypothetical protein